MNRYLILVLTGFVTLLSACAGHYSTTVSAIELPPNVYNSSGGKIPGRFAYSIDPTSLARLNIKGPLKNNCEPASYSIDATQAFQQSLPLMLGQVFDSIQPVEPGGANSSKMNHIIFTVDQFNPRIRFSGRTFGLDADATVEMQISISGISNNAQFFHAVANVERSKSGDGGNQYLCDGGGPVLSGATKEALRESLEKLGDKMVNSQILRTQGLGTAGITNPKSK